MSMAELVQGLADRTGKSKEEIYGVIQECAGGNNHFELEELEKKLSLPTGLFTFPIKMERAIMGHSPIEAVDFIVDMCAAASIEALHNCLSMINKSIKDPDTGSDMIEFLHDLRSVVESQIATMDANTATPAD